MSKAIQGQEDIFSMFGIVDDYAEQQKREQEERGRKAEELRQQVESKRAAAAESKKEEPSKKEAPFKLSEDTQIRVFGETLEITQYFSTEEIAEGLLIKKKDGETEHRPIDGEVIRKRLEEDYPELVKDMTEIVFLKDKNMVVAFPKAKKKGNNCMETSSTLEGVSLSSNQIPFSILRDFISLAKMYGEHSLEIHADIYFANGKYFLDIPGQMVHKYWCEVTESAQSIVERVEDAVKVCEIHSHHSMAPRPSLQDNESERFPGMTYVIVGFTHKTFPEIYIRRFISEIDGYITLPYHLVFEDPFFYLPSYNTLNVEVVIEHE